MDRLLLTPDQSAAWNMAADEAVLTHVANGVSFPTLRLYSWKPAAISIGYFQSLHDEVDVDACKRNHVDIVRRMTGGGAVFHAQEITYTFIAPLTDQRMPLDIMKSYSVIGAGVILGLKALGIESRFVPLNDIVVGEKKISGNAQTRKSKCIVQHGTILLDVDVETMFSLLRVPSQKIRDKLIQNVKERVTSVRHILGCAVGFDEAKDAMVTGFEEALSTRFTLGSLTDSELVLLEKLAREKYVNKEWNEMR